MAYGDVWDFHPQEVHYETYSDGTKCPHLEVKLTRNGVPWGYAELHTHHTKYAPHASVGVTSRVGEEA